MRTLASHFATTGIFLTSATNISLLPTSWLKPIFSRKFWTTVGADEARLMICQTRGNRSIAFHGAVTKSATPALSKLNIISGRQLSIAIINGAFGAMAFVARMKVSVGQSRVEE